MEGHGGKFLYLALCSVYFPHQNHGCFGCEFKAAHASTFNGIWNIHNGFSATVEKQYFNRCTLFTQVSKQVTVHWMEPQPRGTIFRKFFSSYKIFLYPSSCPESRFLVNEGSIKVYDIFLAQVLVVDLFYELKSFLKVNLTFK